MGPTQPGLLLKKGRAVTAMRDYKRYNLKRST